MPINDKKIILKGLEKFDFLMSFADHKKLMIMQEYEGEEDYPIEVEIIKAERINNSTNDWRLQLLILTDKKEEIKRYKTYMTEYSVENRNVVVKLINYK